MTANFEIYQMARELKGPRRRPIIERVHELHAKGQCPLLAVLNAMTEYGLDVLL